MTDKSKELHWHAVENRAIELKESLWAYLGQLDLPEKSRNDVRHSMNYLLDMIDAVRPSGG